MGRLTEWLVGFLYQIVGYRVVYRNWTIRGGELDLVLSKGRQMVVVEVRARNWNSIAVPIESITHAKLRALRRTIRHCRHRWAQSETDWRLDIATVRWWWLCPYVRIERHIDFELG